MSEHHPSKRATCKRCGKHYSEVGSISWGGNCKTCGDETALANLHQLQAHNGEWFAHYRKRVLAAFGVNE